jgi:hypothetical protein
MVARAYVLEECKFSVDGVSTAISDLLSKPKKEVLRTKLSLRARYPLIVLVWVVCMVRR